MNTIRNLSCVDINNNCNLIKPASLEILYGVNPETGRLFNKQDRNVVMNTYNRMCNTSEGTVGVCCDKMVKSTTQEAKKIVNTIRKNYPSAKVNKRNGIIENIELSKVKKNGAGWKPLTPHLICKLSKATFTPTKNPNIVIANKLVQDCFLDNCGNLEKEITVKHILATTKKDMDYTYFDDSKVAESIRDNNKEAVKDYIRQYQVVDNPLTHDDRRNRMIHLAALHNKIGIVNMLIALNTDINQRNKDGETPLHLAAKNDSIDVVSILLSQGADTRIKNNLGQTAAFMAVENETPNLLRLMYNNGTSLFVVDKIGNNLIHHAIKHSKNKRDNVNFLIGGGVSLHQKNAKGEYAFTLVDKEIKSLQKEETMKSNNNTNTKNNNQTIENFQVVPQKQSDYSPQMLDLLSVSTNIKKQMYKQKYGNKDNIFYGETGPGSPVEMLNTACVGKGLSQDLNKKECEEAGGQIVKITEPSTVIQIGYYKEGESEVEKIDPETLYYPKHNKSGLARNLPDEIVELNKFVRKGTTQNNNNNAPKKANNKANNKTNNKVVKKQEESKENIEKHPDMKKENNQQVVDSVKEALVNAERFTNKLKEGFENQKNSLTLGKNKYLLLALLVIVIICILLRL